MKTIPIILLAAGAGRRMGRDKLLLPVHGRPLLHRVATHALASGAPLFVTLPQNDMARREAIKDLDLTRIAVPNPGEGMAASLRAGLAAIPQTAPAVVVALGDMPDVTGDDINRLIKAFLADPESRIHRAASADGVAGNPVLLPRWALEANEFSGDSGARAILQQHAERVVLVPLPGRHALQDLDTPKDWENWISGKG